MLAGCSAGPPVGESPAQPLLLPWNVQPRGTGFDVSMWAVGFPPGEEPPVVGMNGVVRAFDWLPDDGVALPLARELVVELSKSGGSFVVELNGGTSNRIDVPKGGSPRPVVPQPPSTPQLVSWRSGTSAVLVVAERYASARLVTPAGEALPDASWSCERAPDGLEAIAMVCTVFRAAPLQTGGYPGSSVRAVVDAPGGPLLTLPVRLP
jgi:hypothetical protein